MKAASLLHKLRASKSDYSPAPIARLLEGLASVDLKRFLAETEISDELNIATKIDYLEATTIVSLVHKIPKSHFDMLVKVSRLEENRLNILATDLLLQLVAKQSL